MQRPRVAFATFFTVVAAAVSNAQAPQVCEWRVTQMADPFGNHVDITYNDTGSPPSLWDAATGRARAGRCWPQDRRTVASRPPQTFVVQASEGRT